MPAVIPALAGAAVTAAAAGAFGTFGATLAGGLVAGALSHALAPRASMAAVSASALSNSTSNTDPIPVIYGERKIGATRVLTEVTDGDFTQEFLHTVWSICEGEIDSIPTVYLDDTESDNARFSGLVTVEKYTGTDDQAASAALITALSTGSPLTPGKWTAAHQGKGVAYAYVKLKWTRDAWPGGFPVFHFLVRGRKVWDPRLGSPTVTQWSDNPALCILDYLMNARFGRGIAAAKIDVQSFIDAADYCDELVSLPVAGSPSIPPQKRYTCNGVLIPEAGWIDNIRALESSCRGHVVFSGGTYRLVLDRAVSGSPTPTPFAFTEDNIVGAWSIRKSGKRERFNRVRARFFNPNRSWQEDFALFDSATDRSASDNGLLLEEEIALPFTTDVYTAMQLAQIEQKQSRFGIACEFTATIAGMRCEVGDIVTITHTTPGWDAKPFRVDKISLLSSDEVRIAAREYQATVYDLDQLQAVADTPATNLPSPFNVSAPSDLTVTQSTSVWDSVVLEWDNTDQRAVAFQAEYKLASDSTWAIVPHTREEGVTIPRLEARVYHFRVKAINNIGVSSEYSDTVTLVVTGQAIRPYGSFTGLGFISVVNEITVGADCEGMCWCPTNNLVYYLSKGDQRVDVINPVTDSVIASISTPVASTVAGVGFAYSPPNNRIYLATVAGSPAANVIYVINPDTQEVESTFAGPGGSPSLVQAIVFCPVNSKLYFLYGGAIRVLDPTGSPSNSFEKSISTGGGGSAFHIVYCPTSRLIYFTDTVTPAVVGRLDPATDTIGATISTGLNGIRWLCYSQDNDRIYVACTSSNALAVINPLTNTVVSSVSGGSPATVFSSPSRILYSNVSHLLYVTNLAGSTIVTIRPSDNLILGSDQVGSAPEDALWVPSASKIYVAHDNLGDEETLTVLGV